MAIPSSAGTLRERSTAPRPGAARPRRPGRLLRVWVVVLVGVLVSGSVGVYLSRRPGVYWSQVQVLFVAPKSAANPNGLSISSESLIDTAGMVAKIVGSSPRGPAVVSDTVTLVGEGVRHGYGVRLPNSGGQFATNFDQAALDVQAVGASPGEVSATLVSVIGRVVGTLSRLQAEAGVAKVNLIRSQLSPPVAPLYYQAGSKTRALAITMVIGGGITAWLAWLVRRRTALPAVPLPATSG